MYGINILYLFSLVKKQILQYKFWWESAIFTDIEEWFNSDEIREVMFILNIYNSKKHFYEIGQLHVIRQFN